ncbi:hypothetical protein niasHT_039273 [Heterodera trifolii]|uniref:Uncharacterized protein n=1 Tax=Heterodera trifolii TaxID=157864 RepID=A0ABD2J7W1_9BILA
MESQKRRNETNGPSWGNAPSHSSLIHFIFIHSINRRSLFASFAAFVCPTKGGKVIWESDHLERAEGSITATENGGGICGLRGQSKVATHLLAVSIGDLMIRSIENSANEWWDQQQLPNNCGNLCWWC